VSLDLTHFPVDALGRSLVALDVATAVGGGILFSTTKSGISCDVNSDSDTTSATDDGQDLTGLPGDDAFDVIIPDTDFGSGADGDGFQGGDGYGDGSSSSAGESGESGSGDPLDGQSPGLPHTTSPPGQSACTGIALDPDLGADPEKLIWYENGIILSETSFLGPAPVVTYNSAAPTKPTWFNSVAGGVFVVPDGAGGKIYRSVVIQRDGSKTTKQTTAQDCLYPRLYGYRFSNPETFQTGLYSSLDRPPYLDSSGTPAIYVYNGTGYFIGAQGPNITSLEAIPQ
jgi:hypothetical protein